MSQFFTRYIPKSKTSTAPTSSSEPSVEKRKRKEDNTSGKSKKRKQHHTADSKKDYNAINEVSRADRVDGNDGARHVEPAQKHSKVMRKYDKSKMRSASDKQQGVVDAGDEPSNLQNETLHDLIPIKQPVNIETKSTELLYSTLPPWQAAPTSVSSSQVAVGFDILGLSDQMLSNLRNDKVHTAFPVQSTVIPLLMPGNASYRGDLCISAATGSGKTLAYVIPIVEALRRSKKSALQAVIVVPTRELVKQVKRTCDICASGSSLRIVTAVGSKSLRKEQEALIEEERVYDPAAYQAELLTPIDWKIFNLERVLKRGLQLQKDPLKVKDHVTRTRIKADLLITTPGRLVDHLQETDGFHLDDVSWLVVDEADRLLNESYQDWVDTVVPALQSRKATQERDKILTYMRMKPPPRVVRKVLLSATMTKDISKLNQIGLNDPRMITFDSTNDGVLLKAPADELSTVDQSIVGVGIDGAGEYAIPQSMKEVAVCFKNDTDKPLVLLQLLEKHISAVDQDSSTASDDSSDDSSSSADSSESESLLSDTSSSASSRQSPRRRHSDFIKSLSFSVDTSYHARSLIFTRSTAAALRLSRLLSIISPKLERRVSTLTRSTTSSSASRKALSSFRSGKTSILIATDRASRGIDIPGLENVVNYDIPGSALTYIHRIGRTARANKEGHAWTLVEHREGRWFWNEIGGKSSECSIRRSTKVKKMAFAIDDSDEELRKRYDNALTVLGSEVRGE